MRLIKLLLLTAICVMGIAATASALPVQFNIDPWTEWGREYSTTDGTNFTGSNSNSWDSLNNNPTQNLTKGVYATADGTEDSWGTGYVTSIRDLTDLSTIWSAGGVQGSNPGEELTIFYYGGDDVMITTDADGAPADLLTNNFTIKMYLDSPSDSDVATGTGGRWADGEYTGYTEGTLVLELKGHKLYNDYDGTGTETEEYELAAADFITTGSASGTMFLDVVGGTWKDLYDTDNFDLSDPDSYDGGIVQGYGFADFRLSTSIQPTPDGNTTGWNLFGTGEAQGDLVPEPGTFLLFGIGLLGFAGIGRRRGKK